MKNKIILIVMICAIITLSFTFSSARKSETKQNSTQAHYDEPAGGMVSEDKF